MTWQNLPCPATLPAVSQACPDGWFEVRVFQNPPLGVLYPERTTFCVLKAWGVDILDVELAKYLRGEDFADVPHWATVLVRVERGPGDGRGPRVCDQCELSPVVDANGNDWTGSDHEGETCPLHYLDDGSCDGTIKTRIWGNARWGVGGKPVYAEQKPYTGIEGVSLTGQQPAPQPGRGDMWASVIERYDGQINSALVDIFRARREQGLAKYNTPLQAGNGRDICKDLTDETLDRIAYAEQAAQERPELADIMHGLQDRDIATLGGLLGVYGRLDIELAPEVPKAPHPIDDRPAVGTAEGRMAALMYCAAIELERRSREAARMIEPRELAEQVRLADDADLALIGKMAGRAGATMFALLGVGPGGTRLSGGPR